ncbi:MAG TPA: UpxY family transcription antiterminator [Longimicrobiales bacterium]|nr:UpxY family transcription antiterminator [Longimicrobiales bacterium]
MVNGLEAGLSTALVERSPDGSASGRPGTDGRCWYACRTRARTEKRVERRLLDRDVDAYLPTFPLVRRWADRRRTVAFPLFPGYVFARFEFQDLYRVLAVPGLATIVRQGGRLAPIRDAEIDNIRRVAAGLDVTCVRPRRVRFRRGEAVRVIGGPFEGVEGVIHQVRGSSRVLVGLSIGLAVSIVVDVTVIAAR